MISGRNKNVCWSFDLDDQALQYIRSVIDTMPGIRLVEIKKPHDFTIDDEGQPFLLFSSLATEEKISSLSEDLQNYLSTLPRAIILPKEYTITDVNRAFDAEVSEIIRRPLATSQIEKVITKSLNASLVHEDIKCMTREILLEREIFERKNSILSFIVSFMESVSQSLDPATILYNAFMSLRKLLPAETMHAAFLKEVPGDKKEAIFYIDAQSDCPTFNKWEKTLRDELTQATGESNFSVVSYPLTTTVEKKEIVSNKEYIALPIKLRTQNTGIVVLVGGGKSALGRDQVESLETVMKYLGLALSNAGLYEIVKQESELDGLTGLYNRRYFEKYLDHDLKKIKRNKLPVSCLFFDIDNFKKINDTYGHTNGDSILKDLVSIVKKTLRDTDYCSRIGGEEFAIVMPQTNEKQALVLAERLRSNISRHKFDISSTTISVTVSMGISTSDIPCLKTKEQLMVEADTYLYKAKDAGKNCIHSESTGLLLNVSNR